MTRRKSRFWRAAKWIIGIVIVLFVVFFYGVVPWFFTSFINSNNFRFHDPNNGKTPASFGMAYQPVEFTSRDGVLLKGWYVPAQPVPGRTPRGTIVYCHGLHRSRVEMLPMAVFGHQQGYNGLLFDFRNHGESGKKVTSIGYWERLDAEAAVSYALGHENAQRPVVLWGVSMGAAAALEAAAEDPQADAVISDSTFLSFHDVVEHHYHLVIHLVRRHWWWFPPLPAFPLANEVIAWSASRAHFKPADFDLEQAVRRMGRRPVLFIAVQDDPRMPPSIARKLVADDASPLKQIAVVPGHRHGEGFNDSRAPYEQAVSKFLDSLHRPPSP
ncbi:MAG: alpha/beta hydrolase [Terriglobia bacterium]